LTKRNDADGMWFAESTGGLTGCQLLDDMWEGDGFFTMTLLADAPAAPQPSTPAARACKAPDGYVKCSQAACQNWHEPHVRGVPRVPYRHCTPCWNALNGEGGTAETWTPPLATQPAEAKPMRCLVDGCDGFIEGTPPKCTKDCGAKYLAKPVEQPKPAAKGHDFSDPYCARRYEGAVVRLCVDCGTFETTPTRECGTVGPMWRVDFERWVGKKAAGILRDPAIPERIVKPPMAHSSQWAEEAEDVR
jgi:hypothetical protein